MEVAEFFCPRSVQGSGPVLNMVSRNSVHRIRALHPYLRFVGGFKTTGNTTEYYASFGIYVLQYNFYFRITQVLFSFGDRWITTVCASFGHSPNSLAHGREVSCPYMGISGAFCYANEEQLSHAFNYEDVGFINPKNTGANNSFKNMS